MTAKNTLNLGDLAEDEFHQWCSSNGLLWTRPARDRLGWDSFVELKPETQSTPLDSQNELKKVLVQVKGTGKLEKTIRCKLSALKHLVDSDLPAFIAMIVYSDGCAKHAKLLHIGPAQVEAVLRKVREVEKRGRRDLHNIQYRIKLGGAVELQVDGAGLRAAIVSFIPTTTAEYVAQKAAFRKSCGFGEGSTVADVDFPPGVEAADLVDCLIGRRPTLPVRRGTITKSRFGIQLEADTHEFGPAILTVDVKPVDRAVVTVRSLQRAKSAEMAVDVYAPGIAVPPEARRMRLVNTFIELMFVFNEPRIDLSFSIPNKTHSIDELNRALKFGWLLSSPDALIGLQMGQHSIELPVSKPADFEHWQDLHIFTDIFSTALHRYLPAHKCDVSFTEIDAAMWKCEQGFALITRTGLEVSFPVPPVSIGQIRRATLLIPITLELKELTYCALAAMDDESLTIADHTMRFIGQKAMVVEDGVATDDRGINQIKARLSEKLQQLRAERRDGRIIISLGDTPESLGAEQQLVISVA